jgi:hypothetical protein
MFYFLMPERSAGLLADDMAAFPYRGPVHDRIIAELRKPATRHAEPCEFLRDDDEECICSPEPRPEILCSLDARDEPVLTHWSLDFSYADRAWRDDLKAALQDGGRY